MKRNFSLFTGILFAMLLSACTGSSTEKPDKEEAKSPHIIGVSVWDRISTRSEPRRSSPSTTLLSLGESFLYLDTFAIDSSYNNTKFLKVRLSDSSVVWAYGFASVLNAKPAVVTREVPLYMRPDLLTITEKRINTMEIVAVVEEWDTWIKVVGEKSEKVGWIKKEYLTENSTDLGFALLAKRKLEEEDPEQKIKNLEELLDNNPYPASVFISEVKQILDNEKEILRESQQDRFWDDQSRRWRNN